MRTGVKAFMSRAGDRSPSSAIDVLVRSKEFNKLLTDIIT